MAGPPVRRRTAKSYARDVETMNRLRMALMLDTSIEWGTRKDLLEKLDAFTEALVKVIPQVEPTPSQTMRASLKAG